jgi:hypothetical protein
MSKLVAVLLTLMSWASAGSIIVFSNFGPGNTYKRSSAWGIGNSADPSSLNIYGAAFTPSQTVTLNSITLALNHQTGANQFVVSLNAESGNLPGAVVESFALNNVVRSVYSGSILTETSALRPLLNAGARYWIVVSPAVPTSGGGWLSALNDQGRWAVETTRGWSAVTLRSGNRGVFAVIGDLLSGVGRSPGYVVAHPPLALLDKVK